MISVAEADRLLAGFRDPWPTETVSLHQAVGRILREDVRADRAYPAQDRSRMDGIAIAFAAWEMGVRRFPVTALARAGEPRLRLDDASGCVEIMTGAALPEGSDTVIPYEDLEISGGVAHVRDDIAVTLGKNVHPRGSDCAKDAVLIPAGERLHAAHVAIAASVGAARLVVSRLPRVMIVATGDELVGISSAPEDHQLRASNGPALAALLAPWAAVSETRCGDDPAALSAAIAKALADSDILLVTGGVSAGKFDLVPDTLAELGVEKVFHKIAQKPGKPLWFGSKARSLAKNPGNPAPTEEAPRLIFGLPGNPVSSLVCARRYVLPLLWAKAGWNPPAASARYEGTVPASRLTRFLSVRVEEIDGIRLAVDVPINGSGDFAGFGGSDGFVEIPAGESVREAGEKSSFFPWFS